MSLGNFTEARKILYSGAVAISLSMDGGFGNHRGMAELLHTWAVCEWQIGNLARAESLFDHALRLTDPGEDGAKLRSFILYSIASLEFFKGEYVLAQHCISLCLKEHSLPGGNQRAWQLWADVAAAMNNHQLAGACREQAEKSIRQDATRNMSSLLTSRRAGVASYEPVKGAADMQLLMRRDPWYHKLFDVNNDRASKFFSMGLPVREQEELLLS
jgi:tetratricopeptide (TPR) repeat protein